MEKICVFCSSSDVIEQVYKDEAKKLGEYLSNQSKTLIYGGAKVGMMGIIAKTMVQNNAHVIGVIPELINNHRLAESSISELIITEDMKSRKGVMHDLADAFIALPGGFGTLEELVEVITLKQLGYHKKPIVILNTNGFFNKLNELFEMFYDTNFAKKEYRKLYFIANTVEEATTYLSDYKPEALANKWFETDVKN